MRRVIFLAVSAITVVCLATVDESNDGTEAPVVSSRARPKVEVVTIADFYLRDGKTVSGKLLSDDNSQVVIEQPLDSTIVTKTYTKREIDARTLKTRLIPESQYYIRLGEYFAAQTWDFRDDPDDFIQAIRCYERAKQSLEASGADDEKIVEIDRTIQKLKDDREVWTSQVESRAKLKKFEYEAEAENRLKQLEKQAAESKIRLEEGIKYFDKTAEDMRRDYTRIEKSISDLNKDLAEQINNFHVRLMNDEVVINDILVNCCRRPKPPK